MNEWKPLPGSLCKCIWFSAPTSRGLRSSTFRVNLSALYGIGGARKGCVARVKGLSGGV